MRVRQTQRAEEKGTVRFPFGEDATRPGTGCPQTSVSMPAAIAARCASGIANARFFRYKLRHALFAFDDPCRRADGIDDAEHDGGARAAV